MKKYFTVVCTASKVKHVIRCFKSMFSETNIVHRYKEKQLGKTKHFQAFLNAQGKLDSFCCLFKMFFSSSHFEKGDQITSHDVVRDNKDPNAELNRRQDCTIPNFIALLESEYNPTLLAKFVNTNNASRQKVKMLQMCLSCFTIEQLLG